MLTETALCSLGLQKQIYNLREIEHFKNASAIDSLRKVVPGQQIKTCISEAVY